MLWMLTLGGEQEISDDELSISNCSYSSSTSTPTLSCFVNGLLTVLAQLYAKRYPQGIRYPLGLNGQSISFGRLFPLPLNHFRHLHFSDSS